MEFVLVEWSMSDVARTSVIYAMFPKLGSFGKVTRALCLTSSMTRLTMVTWEPIAVPSICL